MEGWQFKLPSFLYILHENMLITKVYISLMLNLLKRIMFITKKSIQTTYIYTN